ncbi:hypothetical protein H6P81_000653 [Aristolochia fimbriata]|uniref:Transmembrane protein n=1 Tax=Aristolochia fimbriata TaxID=158543 RepID=A0AAV7F7C2_ARIFI|nr:hypothetical protein H6P81_000653 [Aristolochia fimbriata]
MAIISDALRQAFMPKREYESLRDEDKAWGRLQRPMIIGVVVVLSLAVLVSAFISLRIVFPVDGVNRPFCQDRRIQALAVNSSRDSDIFPGAFYLTEEETADYYWMVVFIPSALVFVVSLVYLVAGIAVAYSAPNRHGFLRVVENNYCASKRGGVRCLSTLNIIFAIIFGLLALFLGSTLLTLGNSCSAPLFWCYEIASWGLVILYSGTAFFLRRKAAVILDEGDYAGRNLGLEMLENAQEVNPEMERRVQEGFKAWMGSSLLSSDEEDVPDDYMESHSTQTISSRQRG